MLRHLYFAPRDLCGAAFGQELANLNTHDVGDGAVLRAGEFKQGAALIGAESTATVSVKTGAEFGFVMGM